MMRSMRRAPPYDRDKALDAATELFWRKGYHATSLKDLEAALGMKPGSIYAAFKSKEALFLACLDRYARRSREALRAQLGRGGSMLAALADHLRTHARQNPGGAEARACMIVKTMLEATPDESRLAAGARAHFEQMRAEFAAAFERARAMGELAPDADPALLAARYQAALTALRVEAHRGAAADELAALAESLAQEVERLRVAPGPARAAAAEAPRAAQPAG